jgi:hypothetical protein
LLAKVARAKFLRSIRMPVSNVSPHAAHRTQSASRAIGTQFTGRPTGPSLPPTATTSARRHT